MLVRIISSQSGNTCIFLQPQIVAEISSIYPKDTEAPPAGVDDMTKLAYLHEPGVLYNLSCRFSLNEIYVSRYSIHQTRSVVIPQDWKMHYTYTNVISDI